MSTIASPRASSNLTPSSSRRTSIDTFTGPSSPTGRIQQHSQPLQATGANHQKQRRNRAALREYYNLKASEKPQGQQQQLQEEEAAEVPYGELDKPDFDADGYVKTILETHGLDALLKVEGTLVNEIRALDGERKALVYDNYSKLIAATDTIKRMRSNMAPLFPTTSTLSPAISHIAERASSLAASHREPSSRDSQEAGGKGGAAIRRKQQGTVRYVLNAPDRLRGLVSAGKIEEAQKDWSHVSTLLDQWDKDNGESVRGSEDIRTQVRKVLGDAPT